MRLFRWTMVVLGTALMAACGGAEETLGPVTTLSIATAPDLRATVTQVRFESGNGPGFGFYEQYDVWLAVEPATATNAGLVIPKAGPTFVRGSDGVIHASAAEKIRVGDVIQIWRTQTIALGTTQGPPDAPTYEAKQVVIER